MMDHMNGLPLVRMCCFHGQDEDMYQEHHFYQSIDKVNIGGLPFLPNATDLVEQFVERLIDKSPEEIQAGGHFATRNKRRMGIEFE